ncbi:MAG: ankyrin repeat domain-containing protein [Bdellovibrionales bacterium]|nr:ankyrin repeat domain-containing protein [Bdellovibrionales bacterium]
MAVIKIPILVFFLTFFTACHLFFPKLDVKPEAPSEVMKSENSTSDKDQSVSDKDQSVSPQEENSRLKNTQSDNKNLPASRKQIQPSGKTDSSAIQPVKKPLSNAELKFFFEAVKENDLKKVNSALKDGADPTVPDSDGNTAIIIAVEKGYTDLVKRFLQDKSIEASQLNHRNKKGDTALTVSIKKGNLEIMELLLQAGADSTYRHVFGYTPFFLAVSYNHIALARRLLEIPKIKASINVRETHSLPDGFGGSIRQERTAFLGIIYMIMIKRGDMRVEATSYGMEMVDLLLAAGADPLITDEEGENALSQAVASTHNLLLERLLKIPSVKQSVTDTAEGRKAFVKAMAIRPETVDVFLKVGVNILIPDGEGNNLLMDLAQDPPPGSGIYSKCIFYDGDEDESLSLKILKKILSSPAVKKNINMQNKKGETLLFLTVRQGCKVMTNFLLDMEADPTIPDKNGKTVFKMASRGLWIYRSARLKEAKDIFNRLLEIPSVRQNIKPWNFGRCATCEMYHFPLFPISAKLTVLNDIDTFQKLLNTPAGQKELKTKPRKRTIKKSDEKPFPPAWKTWLIIMIRTNRLEFVNLLLEAGADPTVPDSDGNTPLMVAVKWNYEAIIKRLLEIPAVKDSINLTNTNGVLLRFLGFSMRKTTAFFQAVDWSVYGSRSVLPAMNLLLDADADPTIPDADGNTPLMRALSGFIFIDSLIIDSLIKDERRKLQAEVVKRLLSLDAVKNPDHLNAENQAGETALSIIERILEKEPDTSLFLEIRKELLDGGAVPFEEKSGKKSEKKKSLQTKKIDKNLPITPKDQKQDQPLRETAHEEKKRPFPKALFGKTLYPV